MSSVEMLAKLAAYVPTPVAQAICKKPHIPTEPTEQHFLTAVLFADISGFTALSELLSLAGRTGAEELTLLINKYFTQIIETIESYQGQIVKFSGDALTALFPAHGQSIDLAVRHASECGLAIQFGMSDFANLNTSLGSISLSMKVSIGAGQVLACNVGGENNRWEYVVAGEPLVQVAAAQDCGAPGQIILSPEAWHWAKSHFSGRPNAQKFVRLEKVNQPRLCPGPITCNWPTLDPAQQATAIQALECYVPDTIKARLQNQADWLAELRRMTIIFVGLGNLDYTASKAKNVLQKLVQATQKITDKLEGSLDKVAVDDKGTVLLILFGVPPYTHEDDAQRAVACALQLRAIAQKQALQISIGITEGSVFAGPVGAPSRQEYTVIGDQVNLAARLMQHGQRTGGIIISEQVKDRIKTKFTTESLGTITVKGKAKALPAYQVQGEEGAQLQFVSNYFSLEEPIIGRRAELEQIRQMMAQTQNGKCQVLCIEGALGLGKSRLVSEMVREWMMGVGPAYGNQCNSYGQQIPYQAWHGILAAIYGLTPDLTPQRQLARLASAVATLSDPPDQPGYWANRLPLLSEVMGLDIPDNDFTRTTSGILRRNNIFTLIEALLHQQMETQPLLIILEDIHWADELSLSLALHLAKTLTEQPLFLVFAYRPLSAANMDIVAQIHVHAKAATIQLQPFSTAESLELINVLLNDNELLQGTYDTLLDRGQGNPFFLQEIARTILSSRSSASSSLDLPSTIQDAILTRIDKLPDSEKLTLKVASVIGTSFERDILSAIHPVRVKSDEISSQLNKLEYQQLIRLETPSPKWEYIFHDVITQEVVYEGLLMVQRRQLHSQIGYVLEQRAPEEIERLAFHYRHSNNLEKSIRYLKQAAQIARREYANQAAIEYYSQILDVVANPPPPAIIDFQETNTPPTRSKGVITPEYWDALLERTKLYNLVGQRDEELEDLGTLGILAEALNDNRRRALAAQQWAYFYETEGDYDSGLEMIERAVQLAQQTNDKVLVGTGYNQWGKLLYLRGNYETAREYLEEAVRLVQYDTDQTTLADNLHSQGIVAFYQAKYDIARIYFQEELELRQAMRDQVGLGDSFRNLGKSYYKVGQYMASQRCFSHALDLYQKIGDWAGEAVTRHHLGQVLCSFGHYEMAKTLLQEAHTMHQAIGDRRQDADTLVQLGFLYGRLHDHSTALEYLEKALTTIRELQDPWLLSNALTYYSWVLTDANELLLAKTYLQEILQIERDLKQGADEARITENLALLGRVALARKDFSLADTCAQHAASYLAQKGTSGVEHPAMVFLTTYQILKNNNHLEQADIILERGRAYLIGQAAQIDDPVLHQTYLTKVPENLALYRYAQQLA